MTESLHRNSDAGEEYTHHNIQSCVHSSIGDWITAKHVTEQEIEHPSKDAIQNKSNYRNERSETQIGNEQTELCSARGVYNGMDVIMSRGTGQRVFKACTVAGLCRSEM